MAFFYGQFLFTKDISPLNNHFPNLFLLTTMINIFSTTNNKVGFLILFLILMGMLSIMLTFIYSLLSMYIRNVLSAINNIN